jgi:HK97 gp10 family phage protein
MAGFSNAARLKKKLSKLPTAVADAARAAMEQGAQEIVDAMKRQVPVDQGDLRDSINWCWGAPPRGSSGILVLGGGKKPTGVSDSRITIFAGDAKAYYARWVEFGTHPHVQGGQFAGTESPGTRAQPFFYPTWRAFKKKQRSKISRSVNAAIKKLAKGTA